MKKETYSQHIKCKNCNFASSVPSQMAQIEKGTTFIHWKMHNACPKCGCKTLDKTNHTPLMETNKQPLKSVEEIDKTLQSIFTDILSYSPDGEIATLVSQGTQELFKLRQALHSYTASREREVREQTVRFLKENGEEAVQDLWYISRTDFENALTTPDKTK